MDLFFVFIARYLFILSIGIGGIYFLTQSYERKKQIILFALLALPLIGLVAFIGNHVYNDPRPFVVGNFAPLIPHAPDNGFPSDHTLLVSAVAGVLYFFNKRLGILLGLIATIVGFSRVYVGLHHPIDVIGSIVITIVVFTIIRHSGVVSTDPFYSYKDERKSE